MSLQSWAGPGGLQRAKLSAPTARRGVELGQRAAPRPQFPAPGPPPGSLGDGAARARRAAELRRRRTRYRRCRSVGILAAVAALLLAVGLVHHATTSSGHPVTVTAIPLQRASTTPAPRAAAAVPPAKSVLDTVCVANPAGQKLLVVSISKQQMWACAGTKVVSDSPVTTGAPALSGVNDATPTGTWHVVGETTNTYLNGCDASGCWHDFVHYWMPFDGAVGFHDASWQTFPFGSPDYLTGGSHGCVHLPESEMSWVYGWAAVGTTVTVDA